MDYIKPKQEYVDPRDYKADQVRNFLRKISILESSGGENTNHPEMKEGMHAGTSAVGQYGLMPLTAQDLDRQYGVNELQGLPKEEVQQQLTEDPELQQRLASTLASQLLNKNPEETAAYKWEAGQYSNPSPETLAQSSRVRKFKVLNK